MLPWHKPEHGAGCIAFSIPNLWYFADNDGDDHADLREIIFGPLGYEKDTHGAARLIEDIPDPNRNVDAHFHLHQVKLRDGSTLVGFVRGEVGQVTILVDVAGNEQRLAKGDIVEDKGLPQSLMPPTFGQTLPEKDFADLLGWLLKH